MNLYTPDKWVVIRTTVDGETIEKVLASFYGGFTGSNSWKLSSGITKVIEHEKHFDFINYSGSTYRCHKECQGMSGYTTGVFLQMVEQVKHLTEVTEFAIIENYGQSESSTDK